MSRLNNLIVSAYVGVLSPLYRSSSGSSPGSRPMPSRAALPVLCGTVFVVVIAIGDSIKRHGNRDEWQQLAVLRSVFPAMKKRKNERMATAYRRRIRRRKKKKE